MYYPDQRYASALTVIRREAMLPEEALGNVRVNEGKRVDIRDVVANGVIPSRYIVLDGVAFFKLRRADLFENYLLVKKGEVVEVGQAIAGKVADRGKRLFSPVKGIISRVSDGKLIVQELPDVMDVEAGVRGRVIHVEPGRGVIIESVGAQTQGVWGNGKRLIATMRLEPDSGMEGIVSDSLEQRYAGTIVITRQPLSANGFKVMREQNISGVIAPSMDAGLIEMALEWEGAVLLTEGFGAMRMNTAVLNLLTQFSENTVTIDCYTPSRFETRTPEVIVNVNPRDEKPTPPNVQLSLRVGMTVRVTRDPFVGMTGKVAGLPKLPVLLPNGLRVPSARVELVSGETADIPVANLEVLGR